MDYKAIAEQVGPRVGATQEWIFHVLREGIISGKLPGGMQLKQDEISAALNVSHIPVREALRRLEAQGLVRIHANRGAAVTELTRSELLDMMEVRATLSVMMMRNSAPLLTKVDFDALEEIVRQQRETSVEDIVRSEELNYKFHEILTSHAKNSMANLLLELVHANIDRYLRVSFYGTPQTREVSINEHEAIIMTCREGDFESASNLLRDHILNAKQFIPNSMK
ncbi:MAG: GntR family transcriptional regulator [Eubacteriales bacterium]|jgi:DNA-binding GntR family transcriptional regulator|nr:GntR family transcriptional regulator [Eubacteriales bacterium]